jgi:CheY-like chemotaxis protein
VRVESHLGQGTAVHIYLPRATAKKVRRNRPMQRKDTGRGTASRHLLLVDDDGGVREITAAMLRELGYSVIEAGSAGAALDLLGCNRNIDLAIVGFAMPGMNGIELARHLRQLRPALPILFITGFVDHAALAASARPRSSASPLPLVTSPTSLPRHLPPAAPPALSASAVELKGSFAKDYRGPGAGRANAVTASRGAGGFC